LLHEAGDVLGAPPEGAHAPPLGDEVPTMSPVLMGEMFAQPDSTNGCDDLPVQIGLPSGAAQNCTVGALQDTWYGEPQPHPEQLAAAQLKPL